MIAVERASAFTLAGAPVSADRHPFDDMLVARPSLGPGKWVSEVAARTALESSEVLLQIEW